MQNISSSALSPERNKIAIANLANYIKNNYHLKAQSMSCDSARNVRSNVCVHTSLKSASDAIILTICTHNLVSK